MSEFYEDNLADRAVIVDPTILTQDEIEKNLPLRIVLIDGNGNVYNPSA